MGAAGRTRPGGVRPCPAGGLRQLGRSDRCLRESAGRRLRLAPAELVRRPHAGLLPGALLRLPPRMARGGPAAVALPPGQRPPARRQRAAGGCAGRRARPARAGELARGRTLGAAPGARRVGRLGHRAEERPYTAFWLGALLLHLRSRRAAAVPAAVFYA